METIVDGKSWTHVSSDSPKIPCTYCTALSLLTITLACVDLNKSEFFLSEIILEKQSLQDYIVKMEQLNLPIKLFVSYSSNDEKITSKVVKRLKKLGFDVTYAEFDLLVGDSIPGFINDGLHNMDYFIIFLSGSCVESKFVKDEFAGAKAREWEKDRVIILPALLEKCSLPPLLASKKWADFTESVDSGIGQLVNSIRRHYAKRERNS